MLKSDFQRDSLFGQQQQQQQQLQPPPQIPDNLKCGEVYTWLCAGELYAVECKLCEDHPLCPLSEFPQHMDIWHTEWEQTTTAACEKEFKRFISVDGEEEIQVVKEHNLNNLNNDRAQPFTTENDSGLFEIHDQLHNPKSAKTQADHEELLEPFEQVLIEQDVTIDTTTQISEEVSEEEYFGVVNEQIAVEATAQLPIQNKQQQMPTFVKQILTAAYEEPGEEGTATVKESELRHLTALRNINEKYVFYPAEKFVNKTQSKQQNQSEIDIETETETSGIETHYNDYAKAKKYLNKFKLKTKSIQQKYSKLNEIKTALNRIIKDINDYRDADVVESETAAANKIRKSKKKFFWDFDDAETSVMKSELNFLNEKMPAKTNSKNKYIKNHLNKTVFKINQKQLSKFKKSRKTKNILRNRNKMEAKQQVLGFETSLAKDLEYQTTEQSENETFILKEPAKCGSSVAGSRQEGEVNGINKDQKRIGKDLKEHRKSVASSTENNLKMEHRHRTASKDEATNENETEISENKKEKTNRNKRNAKIIIKQNKNEKEQNESETEQKESEIQDLVNLVTSLKNNINVNRQEKNHKADKTIGTETSVKNTKILKVTTNTTKLQSSSSKTITYDTDIHQIETSGCETIKTNLKKRPQNTLDFKVKSIKYLTRKRTSEAKDIRAETNGNETIIHKDSTQLNYGIKLMDKNEDLMKKIKDPGTTENVFTLNETKAKETNEIETQQLNKKDAGSSAQQSVAKSIQFGKKQQKRGKLKRRLRNSKILKSRKKKKGQQILGNTIRTSKRYSRKDVGQTAKQSALPTDSLAKTDSSVMCDVSVLMREQEQQEQQEQNSCTSDITVCKEICIPAMEKGQRNVLTQRDIRANCQEHKIPVKETEPDICNENNVQAKENYHNGASNVSAQESDEVNVSEPDVCNENNAQAKENYAEHTQYCDKIQKEYVSDKQQCIKKIEKQTLETQCLTSKDHQKYEPIRDQINSCSNSYSFSHCMAEPVSPLSPKTEEEHFEFYEPKEKLNKQHITHLIKLYHEHSRLWDQSHPDFCEPQLCRKSWQHITEEWNQYCKRKFTMAEVRIRICTLCQRFVQEKDRLALEGELDECAKFPYYEQMKFLEHQKSLRKRRELYEQQNEKILEIYQHFPILWHVRHYKSRQAKGRAEAFESISKVLKLFGLHLSSLGVQKRIRALRKCYRLEKIRHLHAQVEQSAFNGEFRHYESMQFLDKHIDPFVCRICGKIFEHLQGFREHLEAENHGSILQQDTDSEHVEEEEEHTGESGHFSASFTESENSTDILQRFTPFVATPQPSLENNYSRFNETLNNSWPFEDHAIEEIMENVTNQECFSQQGLDQFINSVASCEELTNGNTSLFEEVLSTSLLHADNSFIVQHPDVISGGETGSLLSPLTNPESLIAVDFGCENSVLAKHADLITEHNFRDSLAAQEAASVAAEADKLQPNVELMSTIKELEHQVTAEVIAEKTSSSALLVKIQCADYSVNLELNTEPLSSLNSGLQDSDNDLYSSGDNSSAPLADLLIHKMIELYRQFPQLWDPNHLDFNSRTLRRQAWVNLTMEFNTIMCKQLSWRTLHRKLTDYAKYYKKLVTEHGNYESLSNKWTFYEDFKFLDDVIAVNTELQRSVHHRDNNFKIIATYKAFPQLWNIKHPDFSKRSCKQRNIESMCNRLQEEHNLQLTTERLKNRLIELRAQYRAAKKQRLKCLKAQQQFAASEFEFYEALDFLDDHIDPFECDKCKMEFKNLTDYNQHLKKEHAAKKQRITLPPAEPGLENVCHICGLKFTTRSNLVHHVKRHEGIRNYGCTMCPKKFYASHALKVHIRSHTKECPYTCEKCGMSFVSASKLNQHVKRHMNQKDFECSYCMKTFFTAFEKDRHERRHLNIRDKICPICSKTFVAGSSYYAHLMLHNDTKRFECDKCDMKFAQYPGLFKHKKRHHNS